MSAYIDGGTFSQQLGTTILPNTTYQLQVDLGVVPDQPITGINYTVSLLSSAGTMSADVNSLTLQPGSFVTSTVSYYVSPTDPNIGKPLGITFGDVEGPFNYIWFDNVRLTATPGKVRR